MAEKQKGITRGYYVDTQSKKFRALTEKEQHLRFYYDTRFIEVRKKLGLKLVPFSEEEKHRYKDFIVKLNVDDYVSDSILRTDISLITNYFRSSNASVIKLENEIAEATKKGISEYKPPSKFRLYLKYFEERRNRTLLFVNQIIQIPNQLILLNSIISHLDNSEEKEDIRLSKELKILKESLNNININSQTLKPKGVKNNTQLPYQIAVLNHLGFFELDKVKSLNKENQYKLVSKLLNGTIRQVKGNTLVLNPDSNEDRIRYTSFTYEDEVKKYIETLSN